MLLSGFDKPTNKMDYNFADQKWQYYCTQARNSANYPDIDRYENFLNQWVRLIPNISRAQIILNTQQTEKINIEDYNGKIYKRLK